MDDERHKKATTTDGKPPAPGHERAGAPQPIDPRTGQHGAYWVLTEEERAKGFVRPVRQSYRHVGARPTYPTRPLTPEEQERHGKYGYVAFEKYPDDHDLDGRFWTAAQLSSGCGTITTMGRALAETYARDPSFYGATFCVGCQRHLPVGERGEFVWVGPGEDERQRVGT